MNVRRKRIASVFGKRKCRRGIAAAEFALVSPLLIVLVLGAIDMGQFVNTGQAVGTASRIGARTASRNDTLTVAQVESAVEDYLANVYSSVSDPVMSAAVSIIVKDSLGNTIASDLTAIPSGNSISVQVSLNFETVRWIEGADYLDGQALSATTVMRRD